MSKSNSNSKSTGSGSVAGTAVSGAPGAGGPGVRHNRRARQNDNGDGERDGAADGGGGGDRSTVRDRSELHYASTASHSHSTTGPRRDQPFLSQSRVLYENTYRIEPQVYFNANRVEKLMCTWLDELLHGRNYVAQDCKWLAQDLSADLLERVKNDQRDAGVGRYKFVVVVNIGSVSEHPDIQLSSRCLWVPNTDAFASANYSNDSMFAVATVFAAYLE